MALKSFRVMKFYVLILFDAFINFSVFHIDRSYRMADFSPDPPSLLLSEAEAHLVLTGLFM